MNRILMAVVSLAVGVLGSMLSIAAYPDRPIKLIVP